MKALFLSALRTVATGLVCYAAGAQAAPDSRMFEAASRAESAVIETLRELVMIESGSRDLAGLAKMADIVEGRLKLLGLVTERRKTAAGPGADMVIGTMRGSGRRHIMLMAHMDTVYETGILQTQPYRRDGNRLYGPGIADDKGGIAVILHSLSILRDAGWTDFATITVMFNPDEEVGSPGSGEAIAALADQHDVVLSFEPTAAKSVAKNEGLLLGASGTAAVHLEVKGRAAHAGVAPDLGRNAIIELSHQLLQTRDVARNIEGAQLNWTNVLSNKATNQIPDLATARGDVRLNVPGAEIALNEALQAKVNASRLVPDTQTQVRLVVGRPAYRANAGGKALAEEARAIYQELDRELTLVPMTGGATDAAFAGRSGKAAVVESFGLAGFGFHARDEYIEVDSIVPRLYLTTRLLTEIGRK